MVRSLRIVCCGLLLLALGAAACTTAERPTPTPRATATPKATATPLPPPIEFATVPELEAACDELRARGDRVMITGNLVLPPIVQRAIGRWKIGLRPPDIAIEVREGYGNNQMEPLPRSYRDSDLKVRTETGRVVGVGDRVTVIAFIYSAYDCSVLGVVTIR